MIRLISIKNFRSIQGQVVPIEEITTFVGKNDAGKSNILRALNLFFNGETDHKKPYNFKSDFNLNAKVHKQRAKEVVIELGLKLPKNYRRENYPDTIYWRKSWRSSGEHKDSEDIKYCIITKGRFTKKQEIPPRSKIKSLLENINFIYIPAIKDQDFFFDLQGKIYDVLAKTAESSLHFSADAFETKIQHEFSDLLSEIDNTFKNNNSISLPQNLRSIFETLEFNSNNIPLSRRGDGVKIRHIPSILRFIGDKSGNRHKALITPQIWGFEEPENNVEFSACFDLNKQFIEAAKNNIQVILTTHSPAIYNIGDSVSSIPNLKATRFHVIKCDSSGSTELNIIDDHNLHQKIGFMPLIAPIIAEQEKKWFTEQEKQSEIIATLEKELTTHKKHRIFVEGKSDKLIFTKAIEIYAPTLLGKVHFDLSGNNSANSATDKAQAFHLVQKHNKEKNKLRGVLILDNDDAGNLCKRKLDVFLEDNQPALVKAWILPKPSQVYNLVSKGFNIIADIESCLPQHVWNIALQKGWLNKKESNTKKFTPNKMMELFNAKKDPDDIIATQSEFEQMLINYTFNDKGKEGLSKLIRDSTREQLLEDKTLENFESLIHNIENFISLK